MTNNRAFPTVGGLPAQFVYDVIERSTTVLFADGSPHVSIDLSRFCTEHIEQWEAAYARVERELMAEMEACATRHEHGDLSPIAWRQLVIHAMADEARAVLNIRDLHPFWC